MEAEAGLSGLAAPIRLYPVNLPSAGHGPASMGSQDVIRTAGSRREGGSAFQAHFWWSVRRSILPLSALLETGQAPVLPPPGDL